jgi:hypothetical protein
MKMGTAQRQNIAVQHAYFNRHCGRKAQRPTPMSFKEWLMQGIEKYQKQGFVFELATPSMMRIKRPGQPNLLRTCADFAKEYREEYLSNF